MHKELCAKCVPHKKCLFEDFVKPINGNELNAETVKEITNFAKQLGCKKMNQVDKLIQAKRNAAILQQNHRQEAKANA